MNGAVDLPATIRLAFEGRTALVTGAAGYIGSRLCLGLAELGCAVIRQSRRPQAADSRFEDVVGELDGDGVWAAVAGRADYVFHLAGQTSAYAAEADPAANLRSSLLPIMALGDVCGRTGWHPGIIVAGSVTEVGLGSGSEPSGDRPVTVYDLHKLFAEQHLELLVRRGVVDGVTLRLANVYGPSPGLSGAADRGILNKIVGHCLRGRDITYYGDGDYVRDYVYIDDVVAAFLAAGAAMSSVNGRHFDVGSGQGHTIRQAFQSAADRSFAATGRAVRCSPAPWPDGMLSIEFRNFIADCGPLTTATGWMPTVDLKEGIDRTIAAFMSAGERSEP